MTKYMTSLLTAFVVVLSSTASAESLTADTPASSLQLSDEESTEMRISFLLNVAAAYGQEGNLPATIDACERILELDPDNLQGRYQLSHAYIVTRQYEKAEALMLKMLEERPDDFTLYNNLAWVYATAEDPAIRNGKKAIRFAQQAMVLAPLDHHVWSTLSEAYYMSGEYEKAYRAITHMAALAARYGGNLSEESIAEYNEQIRKCKLALDTAKALEDVR